MSRPRRIRSLVAETLEDRQMFAGDVTSALSLGVLTLSEAAGSVGQEQRVTVSQLADGKVRVAGITNSDGTTSLIDGAPSKDFLAKDLKINFGGGQDMVVFSELAPPKLRNVSIDVGAASAVGNSDDDYVILWNSQTSGNMTVNSGAGVDWIFLKNAKIGDGFGATKTDPGNDALTINSGAGADTVTLKSSINLKATVDITTFASVSDLEDDKVFIESIASTKGLTVRTGGGSDVIDINGATLPSLIVDAGGGVDTAKLRQITASNSVFADMGTGDDTLTVDQISAAKTTFQGNSGFDRLYRSNVSSGNATELGWEMLNGRYLSRLTGL